MELHTIAFIAAGWIVTVIALTVIAAIGGPAADLGGCFVFALACALTYHLARPRHRPNK